MGCELILFSKNELKNALDKKDLDKLTDFDIIMSMFKSKEAKGIESKRCFLSVLTILFPDYLVSLDFSQNQVKLVERETKEERKIDKKSFQSFRDIVVEIFGLEKREEQKINPAGDLARKIAEKIQKGKQKVAASQGKRDDVHVLAYQVSTLAVGLEIGEDELMRLTVPQLQDMYRRFEMKYSYDIYVKQKLAGAKNVKEVDFWMADIY